MAVKYTPGPWEVKDKTTIYGRGMAKFTIIRVATAHRDHSSLTAQANARLIAAAPELLEALQHAHDYLAASGWEGDPRMHKIIAALDQAEGRT